MGLLQIILIGVGLSMDACSVTISNVLALPNGGRWRTLIRLPLAFGFFQALMPLLGYSVGHLLSGVISRFGPVLVAVVLGLIGLNMLRGAFQKDDARPLVKDLSWGLVLIQGVVTAIDALFVGITFGATGVSPWAALVIGLTTFSLVSLAVIVGQNLARLIGDKAEVLGGLLLLLVALSNLI